MLIWVGRRVVGMGGGGSRSRRVQYGVCCERVEMRALGGTGRRRRPWGAIVDGRARCYDTGRASRTETFAKRCRMVRGLMALVILCLARIGCGDEEIGPRRDGLS